MSRVQQMISKAIDVPCSRQTPEPRGLANHHHPCSMSMLSAHNSLSDKSLRGKCQDRSGSFRKLGYLFLGSLYQSSYYIGYYLRVPYFSETPEPT